MPAVRRRTRSVAFSRAGAMSRIPLLVGVTMIGVILGVPISAQEARASLTMVVLDSANQTPLEGSRVAIRSLSVGSASLAINSSRFAGIDGRVVFVRLDTGRYEIQIRRLGFAPRDTIIWLHPPNLAGQLSIGLRQLHYTLANVTVHGNADCVDPGLAIHDPESDIGVVLAAVAENAQRDKTLRGKYPFTYVLERSSWYTERRGGGPLNVTTDTLLYSGNAFTPYRVGEVVVPDTERLAKLRERRRIFRIPTLVDLADTTFLRTHCFEVEGKRGRGRDAVAVVTFRPLSSIMHPDASGEILLDANTLLLKRAAFSLTHADSLAGSTLNFTVSTSYRTLAPGLAIMDEITSNQLIPPTLLRFEEHQKLIGLHFVSASVPGYIARAGDEEGVRAFEAGHH
jgi:hypothetical protein